MTEHDNSMTLTFRCPAELDGRLPPPLPAAQGLPDWFKVMTPQAFNAVNTVMGDTVKRCPPFIDAMTAGFLIPLICDVQVQNGEFTWDNDLPAGGEVGFVRSPIGFHDASQAIGTPLSAPIASSSNSIISGRSRRRTAMRCCSRILPTGSTCHSRH